MNDKINPAHYRSEPIETIDRIRLSMAHGWFVGFCLGNAMKYEARAGKKPGESAEADEGKAAWYRQMARHVQGEVSDPREPRWAKPGEAVPPWPVAFDLTNDPTVRTVTFRYRGEDWRVRVREPSGALGTVSVFRVSGGGGSPVMVSEDGLFGIWESLNRRDAFVRCMEYAVGVAFDEIMETIGGADGS